jgi:hypothetical protein
MQHKPTQTLVRALRLLAVGAACALLGTTGYAQVRATGFRAPEFYDAPHQTQVKTLSTGEEALPQSDGTILIKGFKIETFRESGEAEMIMTAPQCVLNRNNRTAGSPGPIQIHSGDGKLQIAGEGFLWGQTGTNSTLAISKCIRRCSGNCWPNLPGQRQMRRRERANHCKSMPTILPLTGKRT